MPGVLGVTDPQRDAGAAAVLVGALSFLCVYACASRLCALSALRVCMRARVSRLRSCAQLARMHGQLEQFL